ncbi:MAG TPA: alpha/beta fold hydrolase [Solirubrobacteraceae bacterium]|jgi:pimeloyl-ACP methyl ester carboxylesterase|nr:alpha/beta fold hydrolase [Solirubrobacteraceae bacterium]
MAHFMFEGQRIAYTEYHPDPSEAAVTPIKSSARARAVRSAERAQVEARTVILVHGLLLAQTMHAPLARDLAARGNRVVTVDLLGHGESERPRDMWRYSMRFFAQQIVALMDHLELEQAVVMGTSLGANAALEIALEAPQRLRGMVIEMPVLDNALLASALTFTPILVALTFGEPVMKAVARGARAIPRQLLPHYGNVLLDLVRQEPGPGGAVLQGLFFGRVAPHRTERRTFQTPALVIGHRRDPVHPFSDAGMLAEELPNARLLEADSLIELRLSPERLTGEIAAFLDEVWEGSGTAKKKRAGRAPLR